MDGEESMEVIDDGIDVYESVLVMACDPCRFLKNERIRFSLSFLLTA
jgi:hypothetical protein